MHMKISEHQFRALLDRYINNTSTPVEKRALEDFFKSYLLELGDEAEDNPVLREEILRGIRARVLRSRRHHSLRQWLPIAAVVSLFILAYFFVGRAILSNPGDGEYSSTVEETTQPGQRSQKRLPDGSIVHLNANSRMLYAKDFGETDRRVTLEGEAFFEVESSAIPFVVEAGPIRTEVLGTSFNVHNRSAANVVVTLVEGSLMVDAGAGNPVVLRPHQQAVVTSNTPEIRTREVDVSHYISWTDNILIFNRVPLSEAIADLELWYGVNIRLTNPALEHCVITAKYQEEPLGNVLSSLQFMLDLKITRLDKDHYAISGNGCQ